MPYAGGDRRVYFLRGGFAGGRLCQNAKEYLIASHVSAEPAGKRLLDALGLSPLICANMRMGEGTGAVAALPLLDMAFDIYEQMSTFGQIHMQEYKPLD